MWCWTSNSCHEAFGRFSGQKIVFDAPNWQNTSSSFVPVDTRVCLFCHGCCLLLLSLWDRRKNLKKLYLSLPSSGGAYMCIWVHTLKRRSFSLLLFWHLRFMPFLESFDCRGGEECGHVGLRCWIQIKAAFSVLQAEILHFSSFTAELLLFGVFRSKLFLCISFFQFSAPNKIFFSFFYTTWHHISFKIPPWLQSTCSSLYHYSINSIWRRSEPTDGFM